MKILVTGAAGMLGRATARRAREQRHVVLGTTHADLDIADRQAVDAFICRERPDAVINCAAYIDVDGSETHQELCFAVNARAPELLAKACRSVGAQLVSISTDYVFDGQKEGYYTQRDNPDPQGVYARAKLEGERLAQAALARTTVVRSGWIFGEGGKNFLSQVLERARRGEKMKAISDSYGTPTYAPDLARRLLELVALDLPGIYHVVNAGEGTSFAGFAQASLAAAGLPPGDLELVSFASLKRPAPRPKNSRLACLVSEALGLAPLPHWTSALERFARLGTAHAKSRV